MRYPSNHKQNARRALLAKAGAVAKRDGYAATGIDRLMAEAGATSGAFYAHFGSKAAMFEALVEQELAGSLALLDAGSAGRAIDADALARFQTRYLSLAHVEHPDAGCCLPSLAAEIGRAPENVRGQFERALNTLQERVAIATGDGDRAWAEIAQAVGAVLLARAMQSKDGRQALLGAVRRNLKTSRG